MKRKLCVSVLSLAIAALLLGGCGQTDDSNARDRQPAQGSQNTEQENAENLQDKDEESPDMAEEGVSSVQEPSSGDGNLPVVYMTTNISPEGLAAVYAALGVSPSGRIAVKLSTGEPGSNYLRTGLIGDFVQSFDSPVIVECNTAYGGSRSDTAMHYQVAEDHGYTAIASVDIMDENGSMTLPVEGGDNLTENYVGANFGNYDYFIVLSHFKGHAMAGFGGAIKNISIGIASGEGKAHIHSGVPGVFLASLLGIASPLCMYGTIPIAASFSQKGMKDDLLAAFMMSSILLNPQLLTYSTALGTTAVAVRLVSCFLCGLQRGFVSGIFIEKKVILILTVLPFPQAGIRIRTWPCGS